jgi:hypothetical protein
MRLPRPPIAKSACKRSGRISSEPQTGAPVRPSASLPATGDAKSGRRCHRSTRPRASWTPPNGKAGAAERMHLLAVTAESTGTASTGRAPDVRPDRTTRERFAATDGDGDDEPSPDWGHEPSATGGAAGGRGEHLHLPPIRILLPRHRPQAGQAGWVDPDTRKVEFCRRPPG